MPWTWGRIRPTIWLNDAMSQPQTVSVQHEAHEDHGSTPAAWTAVALISLAFVIGTLAIILGNWPLFWGAVALVIVGAITGKVLAMMGFGKKRA